MRLSYSSVRPARRLVRTMPTSMRQPTLADMKRYGFPLQIYLLNKRFRQQQQIVWDGRGGVQVGLGRRPLLLAPTPCRTLTG